MIEEAVEIPTADGSADAFVYRTEGGPARPGVLYLTDIGGIRPANRAGARKLAEEGYVVLLPNVFYRTSKPPLFDFRPKPGDERAMKRFAELTAPLVPEAVERDAASYVDHLAAQPWVAPGGLGVVGHCFSGSFALRTAAARPDKIAAAASFHGGGLFTANPTSPHLVLPRVRARLYFGHAIKDRSMSPEAIAGLDQALAAWGGRYESVVYDGAYHGWTSSDSPIYHEAQAQRAFESLTALLRAALGSADALGAAISTP
jgi:carboxymethylenebutenolidase